MFKSVRQRWIFQRNLALLLFFLINYAFAQEGSPFSDYPSCDFQTQTPPSRENEGRTNVYKVGVFGIRGPDQAFRDYNITFSDYLTYMVGPRFDPPISFELVPIFNSPEGFLDFLVEGSVDFMFMHTGAHTCIESEVGARSLATVISRRVVNDQVYRLNGYGGVIFTRADNDEINTIQDIRGKSTGCVSITAFGSGQVQFRDLIQSGLHHIQDVSQVVFMERQPNVVNAVLRGDIDVGYVRTDQLERTTDESTGELVDLSLVKVIRPMEGLQDDGEPFPFPSTSRLYPEWSLSAFPHVSNMVARAVQDEILSMESHSDVGDLLLKCFEERTCEARNNTSVCQAECFNFIQENIPPCTITQESALFAREAMLKGRIAGFSPSASYMEVRSMQSELGFLYATEENDVRCVRATELTAAVTCPPGHFKKTDEEIMNGCAEAGINCFGFQCLCSPCVEAFDVDFIPIAADDDSSLIKAGTGCSKFELCGDVEQANTLTFRAIDNRERENAVFEATILKGSGDVVFSMQPVNGVDYQYEFVFDATGIGVGELIAVVTVDGEQIPESPFRINISERDCFEDTGDDLRVPDPLGNCICETNTVEIFGDCVPLAVFLPSIIVPSLLLLGIAIFVFLNERRKAADMVWQVDAKELAYATPPVILGRGTFGMVLLAQYRGTNVAVKRVLPPKEKVDATKSKRDVFDFEEDEESVTKSSSEDGTMSTNIGISSATASQLGQSSTLSGSSGSKNFRSLFRLSNSKTDYRALEQLFIQEMRLLSKLRHPCITTTMGAVLDRRNRNPMMVLEHMELGSLYDLLHNDTMVLDGELVLPMLRDVARGLRFLHSATPQIVHCDFKAANVLVDGRFHAKVSDFGLSRKKFFGGERAIGTPYWMAPELLRGESLNTTASDVYAFGIFLYEVFSRKEPYRKENAREVLKLLQNPKVQKRPPVPPGCQRECAELMQACYREDPSHRPTTTDISSILESLDADKIHIVSNDQHSRRRSMRQGGNNPTSAEDLLTQLFPNHVARALREGRKVEPEPHDSVTVYFSDIVNYTSISSNLSPTKVSSLLDRLYTKFDQLCDHHDVFKVETVGDAYMTVTNIAKFQPMHTAITAAFALDCMEAAASTLIDEEDPSLGYVTIRSGFHSGPVVAHVVGTRNPRYSIIGDTVNTASRMESNSKPGRIQCSEVSAMSLQGANNPFTVKRRGEVHVKGKGEMTLYWIAKKGSSSELFHSGHFSSSMSQSFVLSPGKKNLAPIDEDDGAAREQAPREKHVHSEELWVQSAELGM